MCRCRRACQVKYDSVPVADRGGLGMRAPQALRLPSAVEGGLRPPAYRSTRLAEAGAVWARSWLLRRGVHGGSKIAKLRLGAACRHTPRALLATKQRGRPQNMLEQDGLGVP